MISFDEAVASVAAAARPLGSETMPLGAAHGRVLAGEVRARISAPPADVSAMDGYAVCEADLAQLPATLTVVGESFAGQSFAGELGPGQCVRIFTGAPVPAGADRVVMQEDVEREGEQARFAGPLGSGRHIRRRGSDFAAGEILLRAGTRLGPRALVAAAAADVGALQVYRRPRVALLATGDELAEPGTAAERPGCIAESVSYGVAAQVAEAGAEFVGTTRMADALGAMRAAVPAALDRADLLVVTGGASVGERDFAKAMFAEQGLELLFAKVAIKPGKPVWLGRAGGKLVMGLPGNPTSALVTSRLLLVPLLHGLCGGDPRRALAWRRLPLAEQLEGAGGRETFSRAIEEDGLVRLFAHQDSSAQKVLAEASLLVRRPFGDEALEVGALVDVLDF